MITSDMTYSTVFVLLLIVNAKYAYLYLICIKFKYIIKFKIKLLSHRTWLQFIYFCFWLSAVIYYSKVGVWRGL